MYSSYTPTSRNIGINLNIKSLRSFLLADFGTNISAYSTLPGAARSENDKITDSTPYVIYKTY